MLADGSLLEVSEQSDRDAYRAARVGLGALGVIYSVTLRAVPGFTLHRVDAPTPARGDPGRHRRAGGAQRPLRVLRLPPHRHGADDRAQPRRRPPAPSRAGQRLPERDRARELRPGPALQGRAPLSLHDPAAGRLRRAPVLAHREDRPQLPDLRLGAPRPVHGDGVRDPARARAGGGAPGAEPGARARAPGRLPDRVPARRPGRRAAQPRPRAPDRLHRRPSVPGDGLGALLPGRRGDHVRLRGAPALGQAPLPDRARRWSRSTRAGATSARSAPGSTPRAASRTPTRTGCSARFAS